MAPLHSAFPHQAGAGTTPPLDLHSPRGILWADSCATSGSAYMRSVRASDIAPVWDGPLHQRKRSETPREPRKHFQTFQETLSMAREAEAGSPHACTAEPHSHRGLRAIQTGGTCQRKMQAGQPATPGTGRSAVSAGARSDGPIAGSSRQHAAQQGVHVSKFRVAPPVRGKLLLQSSRLCLNLPPTMSLSSAVRLVQTADSLLEVRRSFGQMNWHDGIK